ncbi:MAG TPA: response regulator transcription factor [Hyphomicrobiales bacterium]|nr:response regulator transcription factor [Hyphomicrobiales bacterium]
MTTMAMVDTVERGAEPLPGPMADMTVALIDRRALYRECFAKCLRALHRAGTILSYGSVSEWSAAAASRPSGALVLYCVGAKRATEPEVVRDIGVLSRAESAPAILMSDIEDPDQILGALDNGARGYIPTSTSLDVVVEALRLVGAGGIFVPASSLISARRAGQAAGQRHGGHGMFTPRQTAVLDALRHGKANKVIAFELNMRESTVKVHVRNIMRKLKARNRTEVAFLTHEMFRAAEQA